MSQGLQFYGKPVYCLVSSFVYLCYISFITAEPVSARQPALRPHVHKQPEKTTRVRTVLNEKQLHTLRTCYNANPRPDALMKEQLVEMTGLSPRVIRVWFQNKRCKDKKRSILMKQLQQQQPNDKTVRILHAALVSQVLVRGNHRSAKGKHSLECLSLNAMYII